MTEKEFDGNANEVIDSPWIGCMDLDVVDGQCTVTVVKVLWEEGIIFEGGRKEDKMTLKFKETSKKLVMNSTNIKAMAKLFGPKKPKDNWPGNKIELFIDQHVRDPNNPGQWTRGVRIREHKGGVR